MGIIGKVDHNIHPSLLPPNRRQRLGIAIAPILRHKGINHRLLIGLVSLIALVKLAPRLGCALVADRVAVDGEG